ncbi:MAG TPA: hypothetical protein PKO18_00895 [Chitinophagales bacterium]|nr:hypothetical protein [Chitinophagales bacterium]HNL83760.1 hypothetical protein [Chitinophagales bacterium]
MPITIIDTLAETAKSKPLEAYLDSLKRLFEASRLDAFFTTIYNPENYPDTKL